ncbi:MAG: PilZ domain-containing protein [Nitrospiraceae bacterium]|nr:MAG: PilZ domain-containing protein [Nitrospiraceae bacterium]
MERRSSDRIAAGYHATILRGSGQHPGVVENLSGGGLCLSTRTGEPFPGCAPAEKIIVAIEPPSGEMFRLDCSVRWSQKTLPRNARTLIGAEIINPSWDKTSFLF